MKNLENKTDEFYTKCAEYIMNESSTPIDEIEFLIRNLKPEELEEYEEVMRTVVS